MCQTQEPAECCHGDSLKKDFVHLHGHTKYSVGDSTSDPEELVKKAFESGMKAIAVTDHGIASSWVQMAKACKKITKEAQKEARAQGKSEEEIKQIGIKFIPGVEMYETTDRTLQTKAEMEAAGYMIDVPGEGMKHTHHFLMLPRNEEGLKNLNRIISDGSINGQFGGNNRTDMKTIEANGWGKGIIATSACLASRISRLIVSGRYKEAKDFALWCKDIFDDFYLELQDNNVKDQYIVNQGLIQMSQETGLELVYTQDYHYVDADQDDLHDTWICVGRKDEKHDPNRQGYNGGPYQLATPEEMWQSVEEGRIPEEAYQNTVKIAEACNVEFDFNVNRYPKYKFIPEGYNADSWLRKKSFDGLYEYAITQDENGEPINVTEYIQRLDYELKVIRDKGYSDYFLILEDIFRFCYRENIMAGPGRGSAAGSLVAFVNKITGIDPIPHKLLFARFLNPERMSAPDEILVA